MSIAVGEKISQYKIIEKLGAGGMGEVYKAEDTKLKRTVALKFLPVALATDQAAKKRFIQEARAASALDHPNICTIYEIGETDDDLSFIVMACYDGQSLKDMLGATGSVALPINEIVSIIIQIAKGLARAHGEGIVHRDIKPANIMITKRGEVKILDFGLAKLTGQTRLTKAGMTLGTIAYMSPEQARGDEVDPRSDIWSLGVMLYEMLTGKLPFTADYEQAVIYSIINENYASPQKIVDNVPVELERIIDRALKKDVDARYSSILSVLKDLQTYQKNTQYDVGEYRSIKSLFRILQKPRYAIPFVITCIFISLAVFVYLRQRFIINQARESVIPAIVKHIEQGENTGNSGEYEAAFKLAQKAASIIPGDSVLVRLWPQFTKYSSIHTMPSGAEVYRREYSAGDTAWHYLGISPIDSIRTPFGFSVWKIRKQDYNEVNLARFNITKNDTILLDRKDSIPPGMIRVNGGSSGVGYLDDFFIDKYEVTNQQFKEFIDAGGYENEYYWQNDIIKGGRKIAWREAMKDFRDATGQFGPATWEVGDYPEGKGDFPVSGISWYEAAAFAEYKEKKLPTVYHWQHASWAMPSKIIPLSNFSRKSPVPVGKLKGMSWCGAYDMAGNVREWCWNQANNDRYILGGGWGDFDYMHFAENIQNPFDRSIQNGFRCVIYPDPEDIPEKAFTERIVNWYRDYRSENPVSGVFFQMYKRRFDYDKAELEQRIEWTDSSSVDWIKQKITFNAAYNNERIIAYLYLPRNVNPPYQVIIFFPGGRPGTGARGFIPDAQNFYDDWTFFVKSRRAMLFPIYKETLERYEGIEFRSTNSVTYTEHMTMWVKDFKKSIDYLEMRDDIDLNKIAFWGASLGARMGTIISAVEPRLKVAIFTLGGFDHHLYRPEVDPLNYVPHIKIPVLMQNGKYDPIRPFELSIEPYIKFLTMAGTEVKLCAYETEHYIPQNELIKESLLWLDKFFGPVPLGKDVH
jgi:serine/threonine protein kinase/predicted esterase